MESKKSFSFFNISPENPDLTPSRRALYRTLHGVLSYIPVLWLANSIGMVIFYFLGTSGLMDVVEPRLLTLAVISFVTSLLHLPQFPALRSGRLNRVSGFLLLINGMAAFSQVFFWEGIVWIPLIIVIVPFLLFILRSELTVILKSALILLGLIVLASVIVLDSALAMERMQMGASLTQTAALSYFIMIEIGMAVLVLLNSQIGFRTIASRLAATFTFLALISSVTTLIISGLTNLYYDRQKIFSQLEAASQVRSKQISVAIDNLAQDVTSTFSNPEINESALIVLDKEAEPAKIQAAMDKIRQYTLLQQQSNTRYLEILLIRADGSAAFSTIEPNQSINFSDYNFFQNAKIGINFSIESEFPSSFENTAIILTKPYFINGRLLGTFAVRVGFDSIKQLLIANTGIGYTSETYLVAFGKGHMMPYTNTRSSIEKMNTYPAEEALINKSSKGAGIWNNYIGERVLGSYIRIPTIRAVLISEIEEVEVTQKTIDILLTNSVVGIFTVILAFVIVVISSRSISYPIVDMAGKASSLANGELSTRIQYTRHDEIGALATSFNTMAEELQSLVISLEARVEERTQELQKQTRHLRIAAEIARDATTSQSLSDLLNQSAQLILDRFEFYHTGIFLLDETKEFAILRASPTQAGQEMLARNHKLKVGQVGIVGNVASTGSPRIALDTGKDTAYFNNPLLPNTRSEMALPLKVNNDVIGVLDVQSTESDAFQQDDIEILQVMADQLALAIQRVQLAHQQEENLKQLESAYQRFTYNSWSRFGQKSDANLGYSYNGMKLVPLSSVPPEIRGALEKGQSVVLPTGDSGIQTSTLAVPIKYREQIIGSMTIQFNTQQISQETINLAEESAGLLATALENARLYTETQKAAERERTVSQITAKIRGTNDPKEMIQIAMDELKQTLKLNNARVVSVNPSAKPGKN